MLKFNTQCRRIQFKGGVVRYTSSPFVLKDSNVSESTIYERKTPREHVLLRPGNVICLSFPPIYVIFHILSMHAGMYLGQVNPITAQTWVYNSSAAMMEKKSLTYSPALVKIFDEILVNAADNRLRGSSMSRIDVEVKYTKKTPLTISVKNDGKTVNICMVECCPRMFCH